MLEESASAIPSSIWASMNSWLTPTVLFLLLNLMIGTIAFTSTFSNQKHPQKHSQNNDPHHSPIARSPSLLHRLKSINFSPSPPPPHHHHHPKQNPDSDAHFNSQAAHYFFHHNSPQQPIETQTQTQTQTTQTQTQTQTLTHFVYEQSGQETQTHFDLDQKDSNFDGFGEAHEEKVEENEEKSMDEVYSQLTGTHFNRTQSDTKPASGEIPAKLPAKMKKSASLKSAFGHFEEVEIVEARRPATVRERGTTAPAPADEGVDAKADDFINRFKQQLKLQRLDSINFRSRR